MTTPLRGALSHGDGRLVLQAAAPQVLSGADAVQLLAGLKDKNPLFASLTDSPNAHLVVFDLTSVGRPSNHQGPMQYQLSKQGLAAAISTLIAKPIHVTEDLEGHFTAGAAPKAIGAFLGSTGIEEQDGTITLRAIGTLWSDDFPDEVAEIGRRAAELGASYEITYPPDSAVKLHATLTEIGSYKFSGGAILKKTAAAHPTTQLLVAAQDEYPQLPDAEFALLQLSADGRIVRRCFPLHDMLHRMLAFSKLDSSALSEDEQRQARDCIVARAQAEGDAWASALPPASVEPATEDVVEETLEAEELSFKERMKLKDDDFALIEKSETGLKIRRFPIHDEAHRKNAWARLPQADLSGAQRSTVADKIMNKAKAAGDAWAKPYKKSGGKWVKTNEGGRTMTMSTKYPGGILAEHDTAVAAIVRETLAAVAASFEPGAPEFVHADLSDEAKRRLASARGTLAELPTLKAKAEQHESFVAKVAELNTDLTATKAKLAELEPQMTELGELRAAKIEADRLAAQTAVWDKLKGQYGLTDEQRASKQPVIDKIVAGQALAVEDVIHLTTGGKGHAGTPVQPAVPLMAGTTTPPPPETIVPDPEALKRNFPALARGPRFQ